MQTSHSSLKYSILMAICLGMIALRLFFDVSGSIGACGLIGYIFLAAIYLKKNLLDKTIPWAVWWSALIIACLITITHAIIYFFFVTNAVTIFATFVTIAVLLPLAKKYKKNKIQTLVGISSEDSTILPFTKSGVASAFGYIVLLLDSTLLYKIISKATVDVLPSPWMVFGHGFFVTFTLTTVFLTVYLYLTKQKYLPTILLIAHFFLLFSLASFVYPLGYGFDPFIHRATESHIFTYGFASPKTPFYLGQYAIVILLAKLTGIAIKSLDIWLVPLLSSILIPLFGYAGFRNGLHLSARSARLSTLALLLYPLTTMYVTTPYNLSLLFTFLVILIAPWYRHKQSLWPIVYSLAIGAAIIHPLSGIFAIVFALAITYSENKNIQKIPLRVQKVFKGFFALCVATAAPLLFTLYFIIKHRPISSLFSHTPHIDNFLTLFREPYYFTHHFVGWFYEAIYLYRWLIIVSIILVALIGFIQHRKDQHQLLLLMPLLLLINIALTTSWFQFPELNLYEQLQYSERLLYLSAFFLLPLFVLGVIFIAKKMRAYAPRGWFVIFPIFAVALTTSFYLMYPARNPKVYWRGYNVSQADIHAAQTIYRNTPTSTSYVVLAPIVTGAASIDQYGFARYYSTEAGLLFYYSMPSGSPLYTLFERMLYKGQKREYMDEAMRLTGVSRAYFVVPKYWDKAKDIIVGATQTADTAESIDDGRIWIFSYEARAVASR